MSPGRVVTAAPRGVTRAGDRAPPPVTSRPHSPREARQEAWRPGRRNSRRCGPQVPFEAAPSRPAAVALRVVSGARAPERCELRGRHGGGDARDAGTGRKKGLAVPRGARGGCGREGPWDSRDLPVPVTLHGSSSVSGPESDSDGPGHRPGGRAGTVAAHVLVPKRAGKSCLPRWAQQTRHPGRIMPQGSLKAERAVSSVPFPPKPLPANRENK